ncbi:hypothetical protein DY048_07825 [Apilactobacillus timberlakei]|uniref:Uncharacterized protein n=1 Tax=Apilactobacillus timberlakei TaxID=2008380 RepID=A0ABY2YV50_9LACO|nr:hypothetical protein DY048_07825 [Apilactobacillus timberlakei]TPR12900.1 hypothetical protein DY052_08930 [Apilactobacillus timberlakei]
MNNTQDKVIYHKFNKNKKGHIWDLKITKHKPNWKDIPVFLAWIIVIYLISLFLYLNCFKYKNSDIMKVSKFSLKIYP